jgi:hypothetical protein
VLVHDLEGHVGHLLDVGTSGKHPLAAVENDGRHVRTGVRLVCDLEQFALHLRVESIHLRAIETNRPDAAVNFKAYELSHVPSVCEAGRVARRSVGVSRPATTVGP